MDLHERRIAQIVRDFLEAYVLADRIRTHLASDELDFGWIQKLVGESEESALYRLKEECHALFRLNGERSSMDLHAEELFDLAVAALFHEGMKFRESYYLTTTYEPRLQRMMAEGSATGPLAEAFQRMFESGRRRLHESQTELANLFRETRDQLLIVLRQMHGSGAVARALIEDPQRSQTVFTMPLAELLEEVYGSVRSGFALAVESQLENGHFAEAVALLAEAPLESDGFARAAHAFAEGMARYYAGDVQASLDALSRWVNDGAGGRDTWREQAARVLSRLAAEAAGADARVGRSALALAERLRASSPA